jgi:hypothetical protein
MPDRKFLETYPLYRPFAMDVPKTLDGLSKVAIKMHCPTCKTDQTFNMTNDYWGGFGFMNYPSKNVIVQADYKCAHCGEFERGFFIKVADDLRSIAKIGQYPAWDISGDKEIEKLLGSHASHYKRGLICESQGYGIAAFAYYRRIVEETIDALLDQVSDLLAGEEKEKYAEALVLTKKTRQTSEKIDLVKDLLPPILRPNNVNPLSTLHEVLSEGLHADTDERCLQLAGGVRNVLTFLTSQIAIATSAGKAFSESMRGLLDQKTARIATNTKKA